jgi:hypothetical protein
MTLAVPGDGALIETSSTHAAHTTYLPGLAIAAMTSIGAGAIHAAAAGVHAEHPRLAQLFIGCAVAQIGVGLVGLIRSNRLVAWLIAVVNAVSVGGWLTTRLTGISWIEGLEVRETPQLADTACAVLAALAVGSALVGWLIGKRVAGAPRLALPALPIAALAVVGMLYGSTHLHSHAEAAGGAATDASQPHSHGAEPSAVTPGAPVADESQPHDHPAEPAAVATPGWPRAWDPTKPIDVGGVAGVTPEQEARAKTLIEASMKELPKYADTAAAVADGYASIGDAKTGSEHFIKLSLLQDDVLLDPTQPESLVYTVTGDTRTLAGAMFIASARKTDDPTLLDWAGPLMQWHNHGDLCFGLGDDGKPGVVGVVDKTTGKCPKGINTGGDFPMVHVWITPHPCGVFAALEGVGAGQAAVPDDQRIDMCSHSHDHTGAGDGTGTTEPKPYDPTQPIDLSGTAGVTPEQQAAAENLVAVNVVQLPQWSDYKTAEAAGFHSIHDGATGFEHFIHWDWINDDITLDPDHPEALVYKPQLDGSKQLVSAMYMLQDTVALKDVPDIGGALMQWHIHDDLCFTDDPVAPRVAGLTDSKGQCGSGLKTFPPAPMIHVWITPHRCGPFAALEGVGAGQIDDGETRLCDHVHGAGF